MVLRQDDVEMIVPFCFVYSVNLQFDKQSELDRNGESYDCTKRLEYGLEPGEEIGTYTNGDYKGKLDIQYLRCPPSTVTAHGQLVLSLVPRSMNPIECTHTNTVSTVDKMPSSSQQLMPWSKLFFRSRTELLLLASSSCRRMDSGSPAKLYEWSESMAKNTTVE